MHKMGQVYAPHPCHNLSRNHRMHCRQNLLHNRTHFLGRRKHDTGGKHVVGRHYPREEGRSASAKDGAGLCTTPMPQPSTQPSHATQTKPLAQPNSLAVTKEARHGRETRGGETLPKRERKVSKCTRWGRSVHHTHATTPPATLACIADKTSCTTVLTSCDEGTITREGSTWRGHISQERKKSQQVHKMVQAYAPRPCHNPLTQPSHAPPTKALATPISLAAAKEA